MLMWAPPLRWFRAGKNGSKRQSGLKASFMPDDDKSTAFIYEAAVKFI
jgi:hypothetical protein